ncbi:MAG: hypothetical protein HYS24_00285 [Ignavibacteriales bacterium]|nr:hypothetical protein [Ignavibacteriales bacterium]MBK7978602.1 hypothetical protein [Ignavibacteriota bacterium]
MSTLPPPKVKLFPEDSMEKKVYSLVDSLEQYIPIMNDRNRLSFALLNYLKGQGDEPSITVRNNKLTLKGISKVNLAKLIEEKLTAIK